MVIEMHHRTEQNGLESEDNCVFLIITAIQISSALTLRCFSNEVCGRKGVFIKHPPNSVRINMS